MKKRLLTTFFVLLAFVACENAQENTNTQSSVKTDANKTVLHSDTDMSQNRETHNELSKPSAEGSHTAKAIETMNAAGYTYVKVNEEGKEYWIAAPQYPVTVGEMISYSEQMIINDFQSKTLNRSFDSIMFTGAIRSATHSDDIQAQHATNATHTTLKLVKVKPLENGYTIATLYEKKLPLNQKKIKLKAQVVKISRSIMGKDWVHLQDGTGVEGTNDLLATTKEFTMNLGDIVTVEGVVKNDVNLGYGYFFTLMLEESTFSK